MTRTAERTEFLEDIITTAVEGGTGYWAGVTQYQWRSSVIADGALQRAAGKLREGEGTRATIVDREDDNEAYDITAETIAAGIGKIKRGEAQVNGTIKESILTGDSENDAGYIDGDGADAIVQVALLGAITYG